MQTTPSPRRKRARLVAALGTFVTALAAAAGFIAGVTPAMAADFIHQPDIQVLVFMVPLTLLVAILLIDAARFARRGKLPARLADQPARPLDWSRDRDGI